MKKIISFLLGVCMTLSLGVGMISGCAPKQVFKNVILVIGDGMGENHILNTLQYFDMETPAFMADQVGYIGTTSKSGVTDSAAAGTALATGNKVLNGEIALHEGKELEQITTIAQNKMMKTGVITTDTLDGATPAAFSAHASSRNSTAEIMSSQAKSGIDLLIGRSSTAYIVNDNIFTDKGYTIAKDEDELIEAKGADKLVGLLKRVDSEYRPGKELNYQLKDMARFAVEYLENENGFFLMIEGAYIDKHSHNNDLEEALCETRSLIDTISFLYEYAADGETAIFITADHETGELAKANSKAELINSLYGSGSHSLTPVPIFVKNYKWNIKDFGYKAGATPENTMVFEACKAIISAK